eukprot:scaffold40016_cov100-Phaeocystis_antarctica.AAC.2
MLPLRLDLSTNALSTEGLTALRAVCEVAAPFQRPLCERTFVGFDKCVYGAVADEHALYLAHGGGPVVKIRTDDWKEAGRFEGHADDVNCVALHGELLLSGSDDYSIKLWRTALGPAGESGCIASLTGHEARVWCVVATDEHIYSCGADKTIIAWSMAEARRGTSTQVAQLTHHTDVVYSLLLAGGALFSSSADKTIRRYDTARHAQTLCWEAHHHSITCLAAAERGALLCSGAEDGKICLWRVGPDAAESVGSLSARPEGSASNLAVYTLAIEPVEELILFSGGADYRVRMWDLRTRTLLHTLTGHTSTVRLRL